MDLTSLKLNKYQTPLTNDVLSMLPDEVVEWLEDAIANIPFVRYLISQDRPYAKDCERDEMGRAKLDITKPYILEDVDYFRQAAIHYDKYGCYTNLRPNSNPNSEYHKFWQQEINRCWNGMIRKEDGAWITGFEYHFLNYHRMMVNKKVEGKSRMAVRQESFPFFFECIDWRYHYLYQARQEGKHGIELAKRGCAKSNTLSAIMEHNLQLGEFEDSKHRIQTVLAAYEKEYLSDSKDGTLSKFRPAINFLFANTPWPHILLKSSPGDMTWTMGYKDEYGIEKGSFNQVIATSAKDNSDKLRGKRGWILLEEIGTFSNLLALYDTTRRSVEDGNLTFATMYLVGTASEKESDFRAAKTLLYNTDGYNLLTLKNVYDKPNMGKKTFGLFTPAFVNRANCYNKDGISDVIKALIEIFENRFKSKYSADPQSLIRVIAEDPITPAEAIIKVKNAFFPAVPLKERLNYLETHPDEYTNVFVGGLVLKSDGTVDFKPTNDLPIRHWGVDNDTPGALEIYSMPEKNSTGKIPQNRYCIGVDPTDSDNAESHSLFSMFVFDLFTDEIVAEYTGRRNFSDENYEIVRLSCIFYNASCMYENNIKGLYSYFSRMNCVYLLADPPDYLKEKQLVKFNGIGNNSKGIHATAPINNYANGLIREWMIKSITMIVKDDDGNIVETTGQMLMTIKSTALLEEAIGFNPDVNVDRIRALGMVMLYREHFRILYGENMNVDDDIKNDKNYLGNSDFFKNNYDKKIVKRNNIYSTD